jgi:hypothetical protein
MGMAPAEIRDEECRVREPSRYASRGESGIGAKDGVRNDPEADVTGPALRNPLPQERSSAPERSSGLRGWSIMHGKRTHEV